MQADHSKLKEEFCTAAKSAFCCENFAAFLYSVVDSLLKLPDVYREREAWNLKVEANFAAVRHISGNFRRKSTTQYKKAAKFSQQKADSATL